jgi:hypothetical protein
MMTNVEHEARVNACSAVRGISDSGDTNSDIIGTAGIY